MPNVLITGASRGIGLELVRQYAERGDTAFATCRNPKSANALNALADEFTGGVHVHAMDVADESSIAAAAKAIGSQPIDILINNAGMTGGPHQDLEEIGTSAWIEAFRVMTIGPLRVVQAFLPNLRRSESPKIAAITSQIGATTWPYGGYYIYATAKAALNRAMVALALDLKDEIAVALIHPGWVRTDMGGPRADITPQESAAGIRDVIAALKLEDSGKFYTWKGQIHPW